MIRGSHFVAALAALSLLAGCDFLYGIQRSAPVAEAPSFSCIEAAIRSVDGIEEVRHEILEGGRPLTFSGLQRAEEDHYFHYRSGSVTATLTITIDYEGKVTFNQSFTRLNQRIPQEQIDAVRPLMIRIEHAIEEQCGISGLSERAEERVD